MFRSLVLGGLVFAVSALGACTYDFDAPFTQSSEGGGTGATTGQGPGGGGGASSATGTPTGATSSSTGDTTNSTSTGDTTSSTSSGSPTITVDCDGDDCTFAPGDGGCCWDAPTGECFTHEPSSNECHTQGGGGPRDILIECQLPEHCEDGEVCCAVVDEGDDVEAVRCRTECNGSDVALCENDDDCDSNDECDSVDGLPDGYRGCL